jgi:hypothetical protein
VMPCSGLDCLDDGWLVPDSIPGSVQVMDGARPDGAWSRVWKLPARVLSTPTVTRAAIISSTAKIAKGIAGMHSLSSLAVEVRTLHTSGLNVAVL